MNYTARNFLITGGAGFIGSHFIIYLLNKYKDVKVINLDKLTYAANLTHLDAIKNHPHYHFVKGDICDKHLLTNLLAQNHIDTIINFAAESHVDRSIANPAIFIETNVLGTHNLLECALIAWKKQFNLNPSLCRFHQISTDEVYGSLKLDEPAFTEKSRYQPNSPYSASKAAADHCVTAYAHTFGLPATISNCSNNYGIHQHPEKLIPKIINCCIQEQSIPIYGDGKNIRDWIFVDDHCQAIDSILQHGELGACYNVGGSEEINNITLAQLICQNMDALVPENAPHQRLIQFVKDRPGHDFRYAINSDLLKTTTGWTAKTKIRPTLIDFIKSKIHQYEVA